MTDDVEVVGLKALVDSLVVQLDSFPIETEQESAFYEGYAACIDAVIIRVKSNRTMAEANKRLQSIEELNL